MALVEAAGNRVQMVDSARRAISPRELVLDAERRFVDAGLVFGHGTDNPRDDAVLLVFDVLNLPFDADDGVLDEPVDEQRRAAVEAMVSARIESRAPAAYLIGHMWFAGHMFEVDERVLVPRSPIAELINERFSPWLALDNIHRVLEIGTGSGCIALATALLAPHISVVATDISADALAVARCNRARYSSIAERVDFVEADLFPPGDCKFDLIVSNPPYVPSEVVAGLPPEYAREPRIALDAGPDGLSQVRRICKLAPRYLSDGGALIIDVGEMASAVDRTIGTVNFTWVELIQGGAGIGVAYRKDFRD